MAAGQRMGGMEKRNMRIHVRRGKNRQDKSGILAEWGWLYHQSQLAPQIVASLYNQLRTALESVLCVTLQRTARPCEHLSPHNKHPAMQTCCVSDMLRVVHYWSLSCPELVCFSLAQAILGFKEEQLQPLDIYCRWFNKPRANILLQNSMLVQNSSNIKCNTSKNNHKPRSSTGSNIIVLQPRT